MPAAGGGEWTVWITGVRLQLLREGKQLEVTLERGVLTLAMDEFGLHLHFQEREREPRA